MEERSRNSEIKGREEIKKQIRLSIFLSFEGRDF